MTGCRPLLRPPRLPQLLDRLWRNRDHVIAFRTYVHEHVGHGQAGPPELYRAILETRAHELATAPAIICREVPGLPIRCESGRELRPQHRRHTQLLKKHMVR